MEPNHPRGYRSLFWPMILIGIGVVWLLGNLGVIPVFNFNALLRLWPLLLIAIGLDMLIGRRSPLVGALIGLAIIGIAAVALIFGQALGLPQASVETRNLTVPLEGAKSAIVSLDLSSYPTTIKPLADSNQLFDATIRYAGTLDFDARNQADGSVQISLRHTEFPNLVFAPSFEQDDYRWQIGLSPAVPMVLALDIGSGPADIDLTGLKLTNLTVEGGSGSPRLVLPASATSYDAKYDGGSGSINITLPGDTNLTLRLEGGSGSMNISLPSGAAVRLEVKDNGSGSINVPGGFTRLSGKSGEDIGQWETAGFAQAPRRITVIVEDMGSGSINFR